MPYLRLYARDIPIGEKRLVAQKLIDITLRAFHLRPEQRARITIQFVAPEYLHDFCDGDFTPSADVMLEVRGRNLTPETQRVFVAQAAPMLANSVPAKPSRVRSRADAPRQIAFQFKELDQPEDGRESGDPFATAGMSWPSDSRYPHLQLTM